MAELNWINVAEKLPEPGERVILCAGEFVGEGYRAIVSGRNIFTRYPDSRWEGIFSQGVTHWMRFPEPPKEGET